MTALELVGDLRPLALLSGRADTSDFGWGGRIRTSTVCINSAVSYRLDHAPT